MAQDKFKNFTPQGYKVLSMTKDRDDRNIAILQRKDDFVYPRTTPLGNLRGCGQKAHVLSCRSLCRLLQAELGSKRGQRERQRQLGS